MNAPRIVWPCLVLLSLVRAAAADEVVLKNGSRLEGTVTEEGNRVIIDVGSGTITVDRSEIKLINRVDELNREYDRRMQAVKPDDANGHYQVYLWTRQQAGMKARSDRLLRKMLEIDPNHEPSRRALGYVNHKGAWLTQDEFKAAIGLVRYNGGWVTLDAAEKLKKLDQDLALAQFKQAAEDDRLQKQLSMEREQVLLKQRLLNLIEAGELPNFQGGVSLPWGMRYWGPAVGARQPTAD
jgi:hypothetical protein